MNHQQLFLLLASLLANSVTALPHPQEDDQVAATAATVLRTTRVGDATITGAGYMDGGLYIPFPSFSSVISAAKTAETTAKPTNAETSDATSANSAQETGSKDDAEDDNGPPEATVGTITVVGGVTLSGQGILGEDNTVIPGPSLASAISSVSATMKPSSGGESLAAENGAEENSETTKPADGEDTSDATSAADSQSTTITAGPTSTTTGENMVVSGTTYIESGVFDLHMSLYTALNAGESDIAYYTSFNQPFDSENPPWGTTITTAIPGSSQTSQATSAADSDRAGSGSEAATDAASSQATSVNATATERTVISGTTYYPYSEYASLIGEVYETGSSSALDSFTKSNKILDTSMAEQTGQAPTAGSGVTSAVPSDATGRCVSYSTFVDVDSTTKVRGSTCTTAT